MKSPGSLCSSPGASSLSSEDADRIQKLEKKILKLAHFQVHSAVFILWFVISFLLGTKQNPLKDAGIEQKCKTPGWSSVLVQEFSIPVIFCTVSNRGKQITILPYFAYGNSCPRWNVICSKSSGWGVQTLPEFIQDIKVDLGESLLYPSMSKH